MTAAILKLPIPPSLNNAFFNVPRRGRVKTTAYKNWLDTAAWEIKAQRIAPFAGSLRVSIEIERPAPTADVDNRIKPILDSLQIAGVIENDRQVVDVRCRWAPVTGCVVHLYSAEEAAA